MRLLTASLLIAYPVIQCYTVWTCDTVAKSYV